MKLFGREPAFWVGFIEAALALLLSWNVFGLTANMIGGIMAVVVALAGVYTAYVTRDTMLGVLVGLTKAIIICMAAFNYQLTEQQTVSVIAFVTILAGGFQRTQTAPALHPSFADPTLPSQEVAEPVTVQNASGAAGGPQTGVQGGGGASPQGRP